MKRQPTVEYLDKAKQLTQEDAERAFSRMRGKLGRRMQDRQITPIEAVAIQLEIEDEELAEWRERWAEISARDAASVKSRKGS
jgi:hypothetical protein